MSRRLFSLAVWLRILIPAVLVGVPALALVQVVPDLVDRPLAPDTRGWRALPVPLEGTSMEAREQTGHLTFRHAQPERLVAQHQIRLLLGTFRAHPRIVRGELRFEGTACSYAAAPGTKASDNDYLSLYRGDGCKDSRPRPGANIDFVLVFSAAPRIAVWTYVPASNDPQDPMLELAAAPQGAGGVHPVARGRLVTPGLGPGLSRVALLAFVWQVSEHATWIWVGLGLAVALMMLGAFAYPWSAMTDAAASSVVVRSGLGAACFAAALGLQYAVLVPPLHAPDEPSHLLGYANVVHDNDGRLAAELADWAKRGHFQRIRFHADEAFRPADLASPFAVAWDGGVGPEPTEVRSPVTAAIWRAVSLLLVDAPAATVLLAIRLVNVSVFALAVGLAGCLFVSVGAGPYRQLAILPYLLVPTLPFFAMHVSEFSVLIAAYVLLSASLTLLVMDGPRTHLAGLPLGLAGLLALASGRNAWPMALLVVSALVGRVLLGSRDEGEGFRRPWRAVIFWAPVGAGASGVHLLLPTLRANVELNLPPGRFGPVLDALGFLGRWTWWPLLIPLLCATLELAFAALWRRLRWPWPRHALAVIGVAAATAMLVVLVTSAFVEYPALRDIEASPPPATTAYIREVLTVIGTSFSFGRPDHLLVRSFWTGFGWIDTVPDPILAQVLVIACGLAAVALMLDLSRNRDVRRLLMVSLLAGGLVATMAAYALANSWMRVNLHGRYLVGWYLCALSVAWSVVALHGDIPGAAWWNRMPRTALLLIACGGTHAFCLAFILERYF